MSKSTSYQHDDLLLFGGCYSNLQATIQLKTLAEQLGFKPEQVICTGDVVGYCAQPEETVQFIKNWGIRCISGNVETQLVNDAEDCGCNFEEDSRCSIFSRSWFPYAQKQVSKNSLEWMKNLADQLHDPFGSKRLAVIHGGIPNQSEFIFASTPEKRKLELFEELDADIIVGGHCGLPFVQSIEDKLWINTGVIGMPANDGTTRTWFAILKKESFLVELNAFHYDHAASAKMMLEQGLPKEYAHTLTTGIWDNCEILPPEETQQQGVAIQADFVWDAY